MKLKELLLMGFLFAAPYFASGQNYSLNKSPIIKDTIELTQADLKSNNDLDLVASKYLPSGEYVLKTPTETFPVDVKTTATKGFDSDSAEVDLTRSIVEYDGVMAVAENPKYSLVSAVNALLSNSYFASGNMATYHLNSNLSTEVNTKLKEYTNKPLNQLTDDQASELVKKIKGEMREAYASRKK